MIEPIYIYYIKQTNRFDFIKYYVLDRETLTFISNNNKLDAYILCSNGGYFDMYGSKKIKESVNLRYSASSFTTNCNIKELNFITFDMLLNLLIEVNNKTRYWNTEELISMFQLILAKWDDWY